MKESKLKQYAATLMDMRLAGKTIADMQEWLKGEGCVIGHSAVGEFVAALLEEQRQERLLGLIGTGAKQVQQVEEEFKKNPAPQLETLVKLHRVLILQLSTQGATDPELLKLADQMTNTVIQCISAQTKAAFKEREVTLAEQKAAEAKKTDREKALEFCLEESKGTPAEDLFKQAFAALKKARQSTVHSPQP